MKKSPFLVCAIIALVTFFLGYAMRPVIAPVGMPPEAQVFTWTFQMHGTSAHPAFPIYQQWAQDVERMSGGRLRITVHPVGTAVPLMETLPAVTAGTLDGAIMWGPFWRGVDPVLALACGQTSGLTAAEFDAWLHSHGGLALVQEAYARHKIHWLPAVPMPPETFLWAHKPIRTSADLRGLKVRAGGFSLDTFTAMGAAASFMPGGETPPALMKKVVDAAEFGALVQDIAMGFHDAAKFAMVGPRAPVISDDVMINMDRWNALPADLQGMVSGALFRLAVIGHVELLRQDQVAMQTALNAGVQFVPVSDALMVEFRTTLDGILDTQAAGNANFAKIWTSLRDFRTEYRRFTDTLYPWK
ncbi:MAG: Lactate-binding periplasmic protein [Firmicutes bacterium]|nr:Lactate-binding periplasmic protein [Bacillota bacterium]